MKEKKKELFVLAFSSAAVADVRRRSFCCWLRIAPSGYGTPRGYPICMYNVHTPPSPPWELASRVLSLPNETRETDGKHNYHYRLARGNFATKNEKWLINEACTAATRFCLRVYTARAHVCFSTDTPDDVFFVMIPRTNKTKKKNENFPEEIHPRVQGADGWKDEKRLGAPSSHF